MKKELGLLDQLLLTRHFKIYMSGVIVLIMGGVTALVYFTGGIQYVFAHTMYIPILGAAYLWRTKGGMIAGLLGGLMLGPLMPVDVDLGTTQTFVNWLYRMIMFVMVGGVIGFLFHYASETSKKASFYYTHHYNTGLPNYAHYLNNVYDERLSLYNVSMTLQINNYDNLIILLGIDSYSTVMMNIYDKLKEILPKEAHVIQMDNRRFWIDIDKDAYRNVRQDFTKMLEDNTTLGINIPLYIDFSLGVSMPSKNKSVAQRFNESDVAALHGKANHIKHVVFHEDHQQNSILLNRLGNLPLAIRNKELFLLFQPIMDVETGKTIVLEALIRWQTKDGVLDPIEFIPIAEETRVIDMITEWVLDKVLDYYEYFQTLKYDVSIAMNISQRNFFNPGLIQKMRQKISERNVKHHKIEMEMTESTLMLNRQLTQSFLESFQSVGIKTTLDDFGTGYSSLSCLRDLPVNKVKIDRDFISMIEEKEDIRVMVKTIIDLAHYMNLEVAAEGVETKGAYEILKEIGCDYVQGFYFAKPLTVKQTVEWLKKTS